MIYVRDQILVSALEGLDKDFFENIAADIGAQIVGYIELTRACLKNTFCQMCVTICGRFVPNEGRIGGKGIKGNALCNLNLAQISRKVVNTTRTRRYADGRNDFSNTL